MSVSLALKVAIPVVAVPSVAGGSYLIFFKQNEVKDSLKSLVEIEGKRIVLEDYSEYHDNIWDEIAKEYQQNGDLSVEEIPKSGVNKTHVKHYCKKASSLTDVKFLDTYKILCSRGTLIDQINADLKSENKSWLLSTLTSDWENLKTSYGTGSGVSLLIPTKGQIDTKVQKNAITNELLMEWCKSVSSKPYINTENEDYKVAKVNCTKSLP